jgi:hypothetical protein
MRFHRSVMCSPISPCNAKWLVGLCRRSDAVRISQSCFAVVFVIEAASFDRELRFANSAHVLLQRCCYECDLQAESGFAALNKPLYKVKDQKNKEYIASRGEMDLKVSKHEQTTGNFAVLNDEGREEFC